MREKGERGASLVPSLTFPPSLVRSHVRIACALLVLALAGCSSGITGPHHDDPVVCTAIAVSSLNVTVRDAASGARVCDATVVAIHQGGERFELMQMAADLQACAYAGPWERAGVFEVRVVRPGYESAVVGNVRVTADECHVIPVALTVVVRPAS